MLYSFKQAVLNMCRNVRLTLASVATVSACIFLFCLFFSIAANLRNMIRIVETKVGITAFFDETLNENSIKAIGGRIAANPAVDSMEFTSAQAAWESFKASYFAGREELAEGFAEDNPLKGSASYTIYLKDTASQDEVAKWIEGLDGVRQVNYSSSAGTVLTNLNRIVSLISLVIIAILLAVGMFLISNTISVSAAFRKNEIAIMRLVGASSHMIRAPFVIEGVLIGLLGSVIPLLLSRHLYRYAGEYVVAHFSILTDLAAFLPLESIFPYMAAAAGLMGVGLSALVSVFTLRKHLKV